MAIDNRAIQYSSVFGNWKIKEYIGGGSNGKTAVFRITRSDTFEESNALKIVNVIEETGDWRQLSQAYHDDYNERVKELRRSALEEVRLMYQLQGSANIVNYLDYKTEEFRSDKSFGCDLLIRMELLEDDLNGLQKSGKKFSEDEVVQVGKDICSALILCHRENIFHRDIKPGNIFRNRQGVYKLGDFGISRIVEAGNTASTSNGTRPYAAPEQYARGGKAAYDSRVDVYSLGLTLYELANENRLPFSSSRYVSADAIQRRLMGEALPAPSAVSTSLQSVILKACAFRPENRFQTAQEFYDALDALGNSSGRHSKESAVNSLDATKIAFDKLPTESEDIYATVPAMPMEYGHIEEASCESAADRNLMFPIETEAAACSDEDDSQTEPAQPKRNGKLIAAFAAIVVMIAVLISLTVHFLRAPKADNTVLEAETVETATAETDYSNSNYEYILGRYSWEEANKIAEEKGGHLIHFDDAAEFNLITSDLTRKDYCDICFLLGGKRDDDSKAYYWVDTNGHPFGEPLNSKSSWCYSLWYEGEPTFEWEGKKENILQLSYIKETGIWVFNDVDEGQEYPKDPNCHGIIIEYEDQREQEEVLSIPYEEIEVGSTIEFGSYEQDNDITNGQEKIEWIVLEKNDFEMLVISKYVLDCRPFNDEPVKTTWERSSLRSWLNDSFVSTAFSASESSIISLHEISADINPDYPAVDPGIAVEDCVFLLSIEEANQYLSSSLPHEVFATAYAKAQGVKTASVTDKCWWWLRSPGTVNNAAAAVLRDGTVFTYGYFVDRGDFGVRPAIWIKNP